MSKLKMIELFAGIRAFSLASEWIGGFETVEAVEINPYCNEKMRKRYPNVPIHEDIRTYSPNLSADVIVGGSPCQGNSQAGKGEGSKDSRSGLITEFFRVIQESMPRFVIWENVYGAIASGQLRETLTELDRLGYGFDAEIISAEEVGAPHERKRIFVVGYSNSIVEATKGKVLKSWAEQSRCHIAIARSFGNWGDPKSPQLPDNGVDHGIPDRLAGLSAYGNAIVPQCAVVPLLRVKYLAELITH
jgi:DNA (cytosine-5)-methyltransferase 1